MRVIFEHKDYRIIEELDEMFDMDNLKGDCYSPKYVKEYTAKHLKKLELEFENLVNSVGVYGYILEKWNPAINVGWETVDSVWGFVGQYDKKISQYNHYIVDEYKNSLLNY